MVEDLQAQIDRYGEDTFELTEEGKIRCTLTKHEFPYRMEDFKKFVQTKKFIRAYEFKKFFDEFGEHFEDIGNNLYGCKLTLRTVANDYKSLNDHVQGAKFKNALRKHQQKQLEAENQPANVEAEEVKVEQEQTEEKEAIEIGQKRKKSSGTKRNAVKKARKN